MQRPTCTGLRVRSPSDAQVIFHAVSLNVLPMVARRLDMEERRAIVSGCVFVWEERGPNAEATGLGIERWTDGIRWGPSRVRDEFLFYHEKDPEPSDLDMTSDSDTTSPPRASTSRGFFRDNLVKQTYSVFVDTPRGRRKWHLIAYFTQDSLDYLRSIDDFPELASLPVPPGKYKSARSAKGRPRDSHHAFDRRQSPLGTYNSHPHPQYAPYTPSGVSEASTYRQGPHPTAKQTETRDDRPNDPNLGDRTQSRLAAPPKLAEVLAPLAYLQNIPPPRRHPLDEKALMSFTPGLT
jgi:hypothetical protein